MLLKYYDCSGKLHQIAAQFCCDVLHNAANTKHISYSLSNGCTQVCSVWDFIYYHEMEKSIFKSQHPMHFHASEKGKKNIKIARERNGEMHFRLYAQIKCKKFHFYIHFVGKIQKRGKYLK